MKKNVKALRNIFLLLQSILILILCSTVSTFAIESMQSNFTAPSKLQSNLEDSQSLPNIMNNSNVIKSETMSPCYNSIVTARTRKLTVSEALGISTSAWTNFLNEYGTNGNPYFVGTPYGPGYYTWWTPKGWKGNMPSSYWNTWGAGHMQCTGFIQAALLTAKLGKNPFANPNWYRTAQSIPNCPGAQSVGVPCAGSWSSWANNHNVEYYIIYGGSANMNTLYNSKYLERGDIVFGCCPTNGNYSHFMIYMGKSASGVPMFWDSSNLNPNGGNQIHPYVNLAKIGYPFSYFIIYKNPVDSSAPNNMLPSTPKPSAVTNTASGQRFTWETTAGTETYAVYYKTPTSKWVKLGETSKNYYNVPASKLSSGTTYTYTVRAKKNMLISGYNKTGKSLLYLSAPTISSLINGNGYQQINWEKAPGATYYKIYMKINKTGKWICLGQTTETSYNNYKNLTSGVSNLYTVRAFNGQKSSFYKPGKTITYLSTPVLTGITNKTNAQVLQWNKVVGATTYKIYLREKNSWKYLATVKNTQYTYKNVVPNTTYTYTVVALDQSQRSHFVKKGISLKYNK